MCNSYFVPRDQAKWTEYDANTTITIYMPPEGVPYVRKAGQFVMDIPVYDQETGYAALEKIVEELQEFVRRGNKPAFPSYPMRSRQINLDRLFKIWELAQPLVYYMKDNEDE